MASILLAAKLGESIQPCFNMMIVLLEPAERLLVNRDSLVALEAEILVSFEFDFNFPTAQPLMERF